MKQTKLHDVLLFCFLTTVILLVSCQSKLEKTFPRLENITSSVYASGKIKSKEQYQVYSSVNGILTEIIVEEGDKIKKGEIIARVSDITPKLNFENAKAQANYSSIETNAEKIEQAKKEVTLARIKLENEESLLKRQKLLWAEEIGSKNDLDNRTLVYENALTSYNASLLHLHDLEKQLKFQSQQSKRIEQIYDASMKDYTIKSAVSGRVYNLTKKRGEMVNTISPIATIGDSSFFLVELEVDEFDISKLRVGQKVLLTMDSYKGQVFEALIDKIFPLMNEKSRSFTAEAIFIKQPPQLFPNLSTEANIIIEIKQNVLTIPRSYLIDNNYVIVGKNKRKKVVTGLMDFERVEIVNGLSITDELTKPNQ